MRRFVAPALVAVLAVTILGVVVNASESVSRYGGYAGYGYGYGAKEYLDEDDTKGGRRFKIPFFG